MGQCLMSRCVEGVQTLVHRAKAKSKFANLLSDFEKCKVEGKREAIATIHCLIRVEKWRDGKREGERKTSYDPPNLILSILDRKREGNECENFF